MRDADCYCFMIAAMPLTLMPPPPPLLAADYITVLFTSAAAMAILIMRKEARGDEIDIYARRCHKMAIARSALSARHYAVSAHYDVRHDVTPPPFRFAALRVVDKAMPRRRRSDKMKNEARRARESAASAELDAEIR